MFKNFAATMALAMSSAHALEQTKLDLSMYNDVTFAQIGSTINDASYHSGPLCTLHVHTVSPDLDGPKQPSIHNAFDEIPNALKRRLARRYEDRGEPIPDYLKDKPEVQIVDTIYDKPAKVPEPANVEVTITQSKPLPDIKPIREAPSIADFEKPIPQTPSAPDVPKFDELFEFPDFPDFPDFNLEVPSFDEPIQVMKQEYAVEQKGSDLATFPKSISAPKPIAPKPIAAPKPLAALKPVAAPRPTRVETVSKPNQVSQPRKGHGP